MFYKKVPIAITGEESEKVMTFYGTGDESRAKNTTATLLSVIAGLLLCIGFFAGLAQAEQSFTAAVVCWFVTFVPAIILLGFAEVIISLTELRIK